MILINIIRKLRITAILLFITPTIALLGILLVHNYLVSFKFTKDYNFNFTEKFPGNKVEFLCSIDNNYCQELNLEPMQTLGECYKNKLVKYYTNEDNLEKEITNLDEIKNSSEKIFINVEIGNELSTGCILNTKSKKYYNYFPFFYEAIYKLKSDKDFYLGTGTTINPFIYGETSISNIAKRYPINIFFKTLLFLSVIIMFFYWIYYNRVLKNLLKTEKNNTFFIFGILSAIFLFLHVFFLGWTFESDFLTKLRRTYVVFFILFEILAQAFLIRKIFLVKTIIREYINYTIIYFKLFFVISIVSASIVILSILAVYNLDSKIDYILEWNYFLILLFFYFLSFIMWKKTN